MSMPHFLHADPSLSDGVEGLNPDPEKHSSKIILQPVNTILNNDALITFAKTYRSTSTIDTRCTMQLLLPILLFAW